MKKVLFAVLLAVGAFSLLQAQPSKQMGTQGGSMSMADCSSLSMNEQQFAAQLGMMARTAFCTKFNQNQRATAMQMSGTVMPSGYTMTPDEAVIKVARDNNLMPTMQQQGGSNAPGTSGGCPVK